MKNTIKEFFEQAFNLDTEKMNVNEPIDVKDHKVKIKALNPDTLKPEMADVLKVIKKEKQELFEVELENGFVTNPMSGEHFFATYIDEKKKDVIYNKVKDFKKGMKVIGLDAKPIEVAGVYIADEDYVYDCETSFKNYFTDGLLSHNSPMGHLPAVTGGRALPFYASMRNRITRLNVIEKENDAVGIEMKVRNYKNKTGIPHRIAEVKMYYEGGFDPKDEYFDFFVMFGLLEQKGAFFYVPGISFRLDGKIITIDPVKKEKEDKLQSFQGRVKMQKWLDDNTEIFEKMRECIDGKLAKKTKELDADILKNEAEAVSTESSEFIEEEITDEED